MKTYAIFVDDLEIHVELILGTLESLDSLREELKETLKASVLPALSMLQKYLSK